MSGTGFVPRTLIHPAEPGRARRRVKVRDRACRALVIIPCLLFLVLFQVSVVRSLCVWQGGGGFRLACGFRQSGLFRLRSLGGLKGWAGAGFTIGDEDGFKDSLTNTENKPRSHSQQQQQYAVPAPQNQRTGTGYNPQVQSQYSNVNFQHLQPHLQQAPIQGSHNPGLQKRASLWDNWKWPSILSKKRPAGPGPGPVRAYPPAGPWNGRGPHIRNMGPNGFGGPQTGSNGYGSSPPGGHGFGGPQPESTGYGSAPPGGHGYGGLPAGSDGYGSLPMGPNGYGPPPLPPRHRQPQPMHQLQGMTQPAQHHRNGPIPEFAPMPELEPLEDEQPEAEEETQVLAQDSFLKRKKPYGLTLLENSENYGKKFRISPSAPPELVAEDSVVTGYDTNLFPDIYFTSTTPRDKDRLNKQLEAEDHEATTEAIMRKLRLKKIKLLKKGHKLKAEKGKSAYSTTTEKRFPSTTLASTIYTTLRTTPPSTTTTTTTSTTPPSTTTTSTTLRTTTTSTTSERPTPPRLPPARPDYGEDIYYNSRAPARTLQYAQQASANHFVTDWAHFVPSTTPPPPVRDYSNIASNPLIRSGKWKEIYDPRYPPDHEVNRGKLELLAAALTTTSERPFYTRNDYFNPTSHYDRSSGVGLRTKVTVDGGDDGQFVKFDSRESTNLLNRTRSYNDAFYTHFNKSASAMSLQPASPTPYDYFNAFHNFKASEQPATEWPQDPADIVWPWEKGQQEGHQQGQLQGHYNGGESRVREVPYKGGENVQREGHYNGHRDGQNDWPGTSSITKEPVDTLPPAMEHWAGLGKESRKYDIGSVEESQEAGNFLRRKALSLVGTNNWDPPSFWEKKLDQFGPTSDFVTNDNFKFSKPEPPVTTTTTTTTTTERPAFLFSSTLSYDEWKDYVRAVTGRPARPTPGPIMPMEHRGSTGLPPPVMTQKSEPEPVPSSTVRVVDRESEVRDQPERTKFLEEEAKVKAAGESESKHSVAIANLEKEIRMLKEDKVTREGLIKEIRSKSKEVDLKVEDKRKSVKPSPDDESNEAVEKEVEPKEVIAVKVKAKGQKPKHKIRKLKKKPTGESFLPVSGPSEAPKKSLLPPVRMMPPPPPPISETFDDLPVQRLGPPPPPSDFATHHLNDFDNPNHHQLNIKTDWNLHPLPTKPTHTKPTTEEPEPEAQPSDDIYKYNHEPLPEQNIPMVRYPSPSQAPYPSPSQGSYPSPSQAPYPSPSRESYPSPSQSPYASPSQAPYPSPSRESYPSPSQSPYASPSQAPYPSPSRESYPSPSQSPYPSPSQAPYPSPSQGSHPSPSQAPYPSPSQAPYASPSPVQYPVPSSYPSPSPGPGYKKPMRHMIPGVHPSSIPNRSNRPPPPMLAQQRPPPQPPQFPGPTMHGYSPQPYPPGMYPPQASPSPYPHNPNRMQAHPSPNPNMLPPQMLHPHSQAQPNPYPQAPQNIGMFPPQGMNPYAQVPLGPGMYGHPQSQASPGGMYPPPFPPQNPNSIMYQHMPNPSMGPPPYQVSRSDLNQGRPLPRQPLSSMSTMQPPPRPPSQIVQSTTTTTTAETIPETRKPDPPPRPAPTYPKPMDEKESILKALRTLSQAKSHMIESVVSERFGGEVPGVVKVITDPPPTTTTRPTTTTTTPPPTTTTTTTRRPLTQTERTRILLNEMPSKYTPLLQYVKSLKEPHYSNEKVQIDYFNFKSDEDNEPVPIKPPSFANLNIDDLEMLAPSAPQPEASHELDPEDPNVSKFQEMLNEVLEKSRRPRPEPPTTPEPPAQRYIPLPQPSVTPTPLLRTLTQMGIIQKLQDRNVSASQMDTLRRLIALNNLEQRLDPSPSPNSIVEPEPQPSQPQPQTLPPTKPTMPTAQLIHNFQHILKHMTTPAPAPQFDFNSVQPSPSMMSFVGGIQRMSPFDPSLLVNNNHYVKKEPVRVVTQPPTPSPPSNHFSRLQSNLNLNNPTLQALQALALHRIQNIQPSPHILLPQQTAPEEVKEESIPDYEPMTVDLSPIFSLSSQLSPQVQPPVDPWRSNKRAVQVKNAPKSYYPGESPLAFDTSNREVYTDFQCEDQEFFPGLYADHSNSCKVFHLCAKTSSGFMMKTFRCPQETVFDQEVLRCNWGLYVDCTGVQDKYHFNKYLSQSFQFLKTLGEFSSGYKLMNGTLAG